MERINQFEFFDLGQKLNALRPFMDGEDVDAADSFFQFVDARQAVVELLAGKPLDVTVSKTCATNLNAKLTEIIDENFRESDGAGGTRWKFPSSSAPKIPSWKASQVKKALDEFEMVFREEMREASTYRVPDRGIFNTGKLVDAADLSFPPDVLPAIPAKAREDWKAAGRCLAFNLLSASGFHVARAVEATLEEYFKLASGKTKTLNGWNDYIKALEAAAATPTQPLVPSEKVISELKQMKDDYRNPIVHPRVVLSDPDARMLFANGESLIIAMAQEIRAVQPDAGSVLFNSVAAMLAAPVAAAE